MLWNWDTIYDKVRTKAPHTPYINARLISQPRIDAARLGDRMDDQVTAGELDINRTQELHIANWEQPNFAQRLVNGLLFKWHGRSDKSLMQRIQGDVYEAFDRQANDRFAIYRQSAGKLSEPFDTTSPFVRVFKDKDDLTGEAAEAYKKK